MDLQGGGGLFSASQLHYKGHILTGVIESVNINQIFKLYERTQGKRYSKHSHWSARITLVERPASWRAEDRLLSDLQEINGGRETEMDTDDPGSGTSPSQGFLKGGWTIQSGGPILLGGLI